MCLLTLNSSFFPGTWRLPQCVNIRGRSSSAVCSPLGDNSDDHLLQPSSSSLVVSHLSEIWWPHGRVDSPEKLREKIPALRMELKDERMCALLQGCSASCSAAERCFCLRSLRLLNVRHRNGLIFVYFCDLFSREVPWDLQFCIRVGKGKGMILFFQLCFQAPV